MDNLRRTLELICFKNKTTAKYNGSKNIDVVLVPFTFKQPQLQKVQQIQTFLHLCSFIEESVTHYHSVYLEYE